ncbi:hypothetical protein AB0A81_30745 [Streptomyces flaveolus]|uniref:hypothetical protein n=1 Tax=Streptomyces flaveolus TaxID=67297 RepID=UPI0033C6401E
MPPATVVRARLAGAGGTGAGRPVVTEEMARAAMADFGLEKLPVDLVRRALEAYYASRPADVRMGKEALEQQRNLSAYLSTAVAAGQEAEASARAAHASEEEIDRVVHAVMEQSAKAWVVARAPEDRARYTELTSASEFRTDLKDRVESIRHANGRPGPVTFEQLTAAWLRLAPLQRQLPPHQLANWIALAIGRDGVQAPASAPESAPGRVTPSETALGKRPARVDASRSAADDTVRHATDTESHENTTGSASTSEAGASISAADVSTSTPVLQQAPSHLPQVEDTPQLRNPWYTDYGMLGEATVRTVAPWTDDQAKNAAKGTAAALPRQMAAMTEEIEAEIAKVLAVSDPHRWADLLNTGVMHVVGGHLVWIRPVLTKIEPLREPVEDGPVRHYQVRFNSTAAGGERSRTTSTAADTILFTALNLTSAAAAASAVVLTMPSVSAEASQTRSLGRRQAVITGRKLFVEGSDRFTAGVQFRLFVDGVEHTPQDVAVARDLTVDFPSAYSRPDEPRPQVYTPVEAPRSREPARPRPAGEVINAIDLTPVIAHLHVRLREAGLSAKTTLRVMDKVQTTLNERTARNRSRWWLTSGDPSNRISVGIELKELGGFSGHFQVRLGLHSLELLAVTDRVRTREDLGVGQSAVRMIGGESSAALTWGASVTGLAAPALADHDGHNRTKGMAPIGTVTGSGLRSWKYLFTTQPLAHSILSTTPAGEPQARYRARLEAEVLWNSATHKALEVRGEPVQVNADMGVPWRDGRGARVFEEQALGEVVSDFVIRHTEQPGVLPGPVETQPHVRALLRVADVQRDRSYVRPARLHPDYRPRRAQGEPLALASRHGLGHGVVAALPGAEMVEDSIRDRLGELVRELRLGKVDWAAVDRQLSVHFGRPALEGDFTNVLAGVKLTVRVGNRNITVAVSGHLVDSLATSTYPMVVNARAAVGESVAGGSDHRWAVQVGLGGAARIGIGSRFRFQVGALRALGRIAGGTGEEFATTSKTYRRMENTDLVDEQIIGIVYEISLYVEGAKNPLPERWWLERPGELVAQVVVPRQHAPLRPVTVAEAQNAGRLTAVTRDWPTGEQTYDMASGAAGLYPAFLALPQLPRAVAGWYARMFGLGQAWADNMVHWPEEILTMARPGTLAAYFGLLTGDRGRTVDLPERDGWTPAVRLRLRGHSPRKLPLTEGETEIEQYAQSVERHTQEGERGISLGVQAALGPQFRMGSDAGNDVEIADPHAMVADTGHNTGTGSSLPGGRVAALLHGEARATRSTTRARDRGYINVTRATYAGTPGTYRSDAVFEVTLSRSKGGTTVEEAPRYLRFADAIDLLVPAGRLADLGLSDDPASGTAAPTARQPARHTGTGPVVHTAPDSADASPGPNPRPRQPLTRTYLDGGQLLRTAAHPEVLRADRVLETIESRLADRRLLPRLGGDSVGGGNPLRRALEATFRTDALIARFGDLLGAGVWAWFPVKGFAGTTNYLWVRVSVTDVAAAHATRPRPEVKLTLRGESVEEDKTVVKRARTLGAGTAVTARGGEHDPETGRQGHGGIDHVAGYLDTRSSSTTDMVKSVDIYRANTRDRGGSHEFEHEVGFRIELGTTRTMPQVISSVVSGAHTLTGLAARALGRSDEWERFWRGHQPWVWYQEVSASTGTPVTGSVRLLVADHMTTELPAEQRAQEPLKPFERVFGENPVWTRPTTRAEWPDLPAELLQNLHPWDVPAADAVNRWVEVAALRAAQDPPLTTSVRESRGMDFTTTAGLRYAHYTSHGMLRPRLEALLTNSYEVKVGDRVVTVGFELTRAEVLGPRDGITFKARRYRQVDEDGESTSQWIHGWFYGGGPEGGGGAGDGALLGRLPMDRRILDEERLVSAASETAEHNQEGIRKFWFYRFDLKLFLQLADGPRRALTVDVPGGLIGMLPLDAEGRLAGGLETSMAGLFAPSTGEGSGAVKSGAEDRTGDDGQTGLRSAYPPAPRPSSRAPLTTIEEEPEGGSKPESSVGSAPVSAEQDQAPEPERPRTQDQPGAQQAQQAVDAFDAVTTEQTATVSNLMDSSLVLRGADGRAVAVWLPGTDATAPERSPGTLASLPDLEGDNLLVFGPPVPQHLPAERVAALLSSLAPGTPPMLMMRGADTLAVPLSEAMNLPVVASRHGAELRPGDGTLSEAPAPGATGQGRGFLLFDTENPQGVHAFDGRRVAPWDPAATGPVTVERVPEDGDGDLSGLGEPVGVLPEVRTLGVPRAGLPFMAQVIRQLRDLVRKLGVTVEEAVWDKLPQRLLANYRYLVPGAEEPVAGEPGSTGPGTGLLVPLGPVEVLITLDPRDPRAVTAPAGSYDRPSASAVTAEAARLETLPEEPEAPAAEGTVTPATTEQHAETGPQPLLVPRDDQPNRLHANETINASYLTGAHTNSHSGSTSAFRAGVSMSYGIGLTPSVLNVFRIGAGVSGTANASGRSTTQVGDAEGGHVEDSRADSALLAYRADWSVKLRTDGARPWQNVPSVKLETTGPERLMLYVPEHYLRTAGDQITATGTQGLEHRLPAIHFASGLTNLPALMDAIVAQLRAQGLDLPLGDVTRDELHQRLWNLDAHLDEAVNDERGYHFALHRRGQVVATVLVHTVRESRGTRVGITTDVAHVENVRTAIDGVGASHTIGQSSALTGFVELDILPLPFKNPALSLGFNASLGMTWSNSDGLSTGRNGLWVLVPRYTGFTGGYRLEFTHSAWVSVVGEQPVRTAAVSGQGMVRLPEPEAFKHGFPVDVTALKPDAGATVEDGGTERGRTVAYGPELVRRTGRREGDPEELNPPAHVAAGHGLGTGLVDVDPETIRTVYRRLEETLVPLGFLPPDRVAPLSNAHWYSHAHKRDSQLENHELLDKYVSQRGFESHYDQIHQSGLSFTLYKRRGTLGVDFDVDAVRITIKAKGSEDTAPTFEGTTDAHHMVNLAMGMGIAGQSTGGSTRLSLSVRFKWLLHQLKSSGHGFDIYRQISATDAVTYLHNRPELMEYPGILNLFGLYSDYTVSLEFQHSGLQGRIRPGIRNPAPIELPAQRALAYLAPLVHVSDPADPRATAEAELVPAALDHAVISYLNVSGVYEAAITVLGGLTGPQGNADQELRAFTGTIMMRAFFKEIARKLYSSDQFFDPGIIRDTFGAVSVSAKLGRARFTGSTPSNFVSGNIYLSMGQTSQSQSDSWGVRAVQTDLTLGGPAQPGNPDGIGFLQGGADAGRSWQWNTTHSEGRTGAKEHIQLDFSRAYEYTVPLDFKISTRLEKHGKFALQKVRHDERVVGDREMRMLLPEPVALEWYGRRTDRLPVPDEQLVDAMNRWGSGQVKLSGNTVAAVLTRWVQDAKDLPADLPQQLEWDRAALAGLLVTLHDNGALTVLDPATRTAFNERFGLILRDPEDAYRDITLPEYLTRDDPGGRILGHSGLEKLTYEDGPAGKRRTTYDIVVEEIEKTAPGLLAANAELWTRDGRRIGRLQGANAMLESLLAPGRDATLWEDLLSPNGQSFYLVNPIGWLLADVVEINLSAILTSAPRPVDFRPDTGLENYGHGGVSSSRGTTRDTGQSLTLARFGGGETNAYDQVALSIATGNQRGLTIAEAGTSEQTVYDYTGHYLVEIDHSFTVQVRRLNMGGRPLNDFLAGLYRGLDGHRSAENTATVHGTLQLQIPRSVGEFEPLPGAELPRDLRPLPPLPGDAYVTGALLDDALPAARKLLKQVFGREASGQNTRTSLSISQLFTRTQLANHLLEATAGRRYLLADGIFIPGRSSRRARLWMTGDLVDLQILGPMKGTGTGRYIKHQSGTTQNTSNNFWRPNANLGTSGSGMLHTHTPATDAQDHAFPPYTGGGDTAVSHTTSASLSGAGTENYRREQHVKQQGERVFLVRLRGRYTLSAESYTKRLLLPPSQGGHYRSDPFTGDVYVEVFESELDELRTRIADRRQEETEAEAGWRALESAPHFDLTHLLTDAAGTRGATAGRAHHLVARAVRDLESGPLDAAVLTLDTERLAEKALQRTLDWAVDTMRADLAQARVAAPDTESPRLLGYYEDLRSGFQSLAGLPATADELTDAIIRDVGDVRARLLDDPNLPPAQLPPVIAFRALSPDHLLRDLAHELDAHVRLELSLPGGEQRTRWAQPDGRVLAFDPLDAAAPGRAALTSQEAQDAGLIGPGLRRAVDELGFDSGQLGAVYRTSWRARRTFAAAMYQEVESRRARMAEIDPRLPELLRALTAAAERETLPADPTDTGPESPGTWERSEHQRALDEVLALIHGTEPTAAAAARVAALWETVEVPLAPSPAERAAADVVQPAPSARNIEGPVAPSATEVTRTTEPAEVPARPETRPEVADVEHAETSRDDARVTGPADDRLAPFWEALRIWERPVAEEVTDLERRLGARHGARSLVMLPGHSLYAISHRGTVNWFDLSTKEQVAAPGDDVDIIRSVEFDRDGTLIDPPGSPGNPSGAVVRFPELRVGTNLVRVLGLDSHGRRVVLGTGRPDDTAARESAAPEATIPEPAARQSLRAQRTETATEDATGTGAEPESGTDEQSATAESRTGDGTAPPQPADRTARRQPERTRIQTGGETGRTAQVTEAYTVHRGSESEADGVFRRISPIRPSDNGELRLATLRQDLTMDDHPPLHMSGDGTLALSAAGEVREAFTTRAAHERAAAALRAADSGVELLLDEDVFLTVSHQGTERVLHRVRPEFTETPTDVGRDLARDLIGGMPDHLVIRDRQGSISPGPVRAADGLTVSELHRLTVVIAEVADGTHLTPRTPNVFWAADRAGVRGHDDTAPPLTPLPGRTYGAYPGADQHEPYRRLQNMAAEIGVNSHAWAEIGEAYLTQSIGEPGPDGTLSLQNHTHAFHPVDNPLGSHYATVVLASEDGSSQVTLENYQRSGSIRRASEKIVEENLARFADRLGELRARYQDEADAARPGSRESALATDALRAVDGLRALRDARVAAERLPAGVERDAALARAERTGRVAQQRLRTLSRKLGLPRSGEQWHMRLVGARPHETFHEQMAGLREGGSPGIVGNPITAVVVGGHNAPVGPASWFTFDEGRKELSADDESRLRRLARQVARVGLWNSSHGMPLPRITISTGGNGVREGRVRNRGAGLLDRTRRARETAAARATHLEAVFRRHLQESLDSLGNLPGPDGSKNPSGAEGRTGDARQNVLTADHFTVVPHNRGRDLPPGTRPSPDHPADALRRRAIFDVEMHPAGERPASATADAPQHSARVSPLLTPLSARPPRTPLLLPLRTPTVASPGHDRQSAAESGGLPPLPPRVSPSVGEATPTRLPLPPSPALALPAHHGGPVIVGATRWLDSRLNPHTPKVPRGFTADQPPTAVRPGITTESSSADVARVTDGTRVGDNNTGLLAVPPVGERPLTVRPAPAQQPTASRQVSTREHVMAVLGGARLKDASLTGADDAAGTVARAQLDRPVNRVLDEAGLKRAIKDARAAHQLSGGRQPAAGPISRSPLDLSEQECLTLLYALRDQLFTLGIRPADTVDDGVVGVRPQEGRLALGPGWQAVESWETVRDAVVASGRGTTALVLGRSTSGKGHAWAAYGLPADAPETGARVVWVDLAAANGQEVTEDIPALAPAPVEARALIVGPAAQVVADALPGFVASSSTQHALVDPAPIHQYGAVGTESEDQHPLLVAPGRELVPGVALATHTSGAQLVLDRRAFYRDGNGVLHATPREAANAAEGQPEPEVYDIPEIVLPPLAVLPGDRHRMSVADGMALHRGTRALLAVPDAEGRPVSLRRLLEAGQGWQLTAAGDRIQVAPSVAGAGHPTYTQFTVGVPAGGLTIMLDLVMTRLSRPAFAPILEGGRAFADRIAAAYAWALLGRDISREQLPFLTGVAGLDDLHGYAWLLFNHVAAGPVRSRFFPASLVKNMLPAASRTPFSVIRSTLPPQVRSFLDQNEGPLVTTFTAMLRHVLGQYRPASGTNLPDDTHNVLDETTWSGITHRNYLIAGIRGTTPHGTEVSQAETVGMTDYHEMDTNDGRIAIPLALLELRHFGAHQLSDDEVAGALDQIARASRFAYSQAERFQGGNNAGLSAAEATGVLLHPLVTAVTAGFRALDGLVAPMPGGRSLPLMHVTEQAYLAGRVAEVAARGGPPSSSVASTLRRLRETVRRILSSSPPGVPPMPSALRARYTAAETALQRALDVATGMSSGPHPGPRSR